MAEIGPPQNIIGLSLITPPLNLESILTSSSFSALGGILVTVNLEDMALLGRKEVSCVSATHEERLAEKQRKSFR